MNSLKLMMVALLGLLIAGQTFAERRMREALGDFRLRWNIEVLRPYIPRDITSNFAPEFGGTQNICNKNGYAVTGGLAGAMSRDPISDGFCFKYYSKSQDSYWVIFYSNNRNSFNKENTRVFQVFGKKHIPWVAFENRDNQNPTYMSNEAWEFAGNKGLSNPYVSVPEPTRDCEEIRNPLEKEACQN